MTLDRRYTDHIEKASDHDLLTKLNSKMDSVCKAHKDTQDFLKDSIKTIDTRCESRLVLINQNHDKAVDKPMFKWLIGILIIVLLAGFSVAKMNSSAISKSEATIIANGKQIGENAKAIHKLIARDKE